MEQVKYFLMIKSCWIRVFLTTNLLLLLNLPEVYTQTSEVGLPYIQKIIISELSSSNKNYAIDQDNQGIIYFANNNAIISFDGSDFHQFKLQGKTNIAIDKTGKIYIGGISNFGLLEFNDQNEREISNLNTDSIDIGHINDIVALDSKVYFTTGNKLYVYDSIHLKELDKGDRYIRLFKVNDHLYVYKHRDELASLEENILWSIPSGEYFSNHTIVDILPSPDGSIMAKCEGTKGFVKIEFDTISIFNTEADDFFVSNGYRKGWRLSNGEYAIATERAGIVILNAEGKIKYLLGKKEGLLENTIQNIFVDKSNNIWTAHSNGISRVEYPSPVTYFGEMEGLNGNVNAITRHNGVIYTGTSQELYFYKQRSTSLGFKKEFKRIGGFNDEAKSFFKLNGQLYITGSTGIYKLNNFTAQKIFFNQINTAIQSEYDSSLIYIGTDRGIVLLREKNGILQRIGELSIASMPVRSIAEEAPGVLWIDEDYTNLVRIDMNSANSASNFQLFSPGKGLPRNNDWLTICKSPAGLLFPTTHGVLRYSSDSNYFFPDTISNLESLKKQWVFPVAKYGKTDFIFATGSDNKAFKRIMYAQKTNKGYTLNTLAANKLDGHVINTIFTEEDKSIVWFGGLGGLIRFDKKQAIKKKPFFKPVIAKVSFGNGNYTELYPDEKKTQPSVYDYFSNDVRFQFSSTSFTSENKNFYQYYLKGYDNNWSGWTNNQVKEYTNLDHGVYTFFVRTKDINNVISDIASYTFIITPPFYKTWWAYLSYTILLVLLYYMVNTLRTSYYQRERTKLENIIKERTEELNKEKEKSELLLNNVLPKDTANELKHTGKSLPRKYKMVTVLFADIQGFTRIAEQMNPDKLVDKLDNFFYHFDSVVEKHNIEKIKTIGDAYMCAGGLPTKNSTNPVEVVLAALEMQQYMADLKSKGIKIWDLRIGIHTGQVIAGVVGRKKLSYDIWGDTVNTASRMESSGEANKVNISGITYGLVKNYFICEYRGKMPVKYKGEIDMYFVKGIRPQLSINLKGIPNRRFRTQLQLLRLLDLEEFITNKLRAELPENFYFHNLRHTLDVYMQVELLGRAENVSDEELLLLKTAALLHDIGYLHDYSNHEAKSIELARLILPDYNYSIEQIDKIAKLISVTEVPQQPTDLMEEIICDADLNYLGRIDFMDIADTLYAELSEFKKVKSKEEWNKRQLQFLHDHKYFTKTARKLKEFKIEQQIEKIQNLE